MILQWLLNILLSIVDIILSFLDVLPQFPETLQTGINTIYSYMVSGVNMVNFLYPLSHLAYVIPIAIAVINFQNVYRIIMWIIHKIPSNIS